METEQDGTGPKMVCENVWKVYGEDPARFFTTRSAAGDPRDIYREVIRGGHIPAACNVSFSVYPGEIFVIMGLSGSGKSTMVRCLSRLVEPTWGRIFLDGDDLLGKSEAELIEIRRHKMGMVFQSFGLMPHLNVLENVAFPLKVQGMAVAARRERATKMIELVGLEGREDSFPRELSGGQQQRVGIARSLAVEPDVWFLDEPFSALDPLIRRQMQDEFLRLQRMLHKTIVFITHDFMEALRLADRIAVMKDGWVEQIGTPADVIMRPETDYVSEFTREVPRASVLTAADIMRETGTPDGANRVNAATPVEELFGRFSGTDPDESLTVERDGVPVGAVTAVDILRALAET